MYCLFYCLKQTYGHCIEFHSPLEAGAELVDTFSGIGFLMRESAMWAVFSTAAQGNRLCRYNSTPSSPDRYETDTQNGTCRYLSLRLFIRSETPRAAVIDRSSMSPLPRETPNGDMGAPPRQLCT